MPYPCVIDAILTAPPSNRPNMSPRATVSVKKKIWKYQNGRITDLPLLSEAEPMPPIIDNDTFPCKIIQLSENKCYVFVKENNTIHKAFNYYTSERSVGSLLEDMNEKGAQTIEDKDDDNLTIMIDFAFAPTRNKEDKELISKYLCG